MRVSPGFYGIVEQLDASILLDEIYRLGQHLVSMLRRRANYGHSEGAALPQIVVGNLGYRDIKPIVNPFFQTLDYSTLVF